MADETNVVYRTLRRDEREFSLRLMAREGWAYSEADMDNFMAWEPDGNIVAEIDGCPVGYATTISYGDIGWTGNVVVAKKHRGKGIGIGLVDAGEALLRSKGGRTLVLNAYMHTVEFYRKIGFKEMAHLWVLRGALGRHGPKIDAQGFSVEPLSDLSEVLRMDREVFGADRSRVLRTVFERNPVHSAGLRDHAGGLTGFMIGKRWMGGLELGPIICDRGLAPQGVPAMLDVLTGTFPADRPVFTVMYGCDMQIEKALHARGISRGEGMIMMYRGEGVVIDERRTISIGALEKG